MPSHISPLISSLLQTIRDDGFVAEFLPAGVIRVAIVVKRVFCLTNEVEESLEIHDLEPNWFSVLSFLGYC